MTVEQIEALKLGISPIDDRAALIIEGGIDWLIENTTLEIDKEDLSTLPAVAKLFLIKFNEVQSVSAGVASESIQGLSQSFNSGDNSAVMWGIAENLLSSYMKSRIRFVAAERKWR